MNLFLKYLFIYQILYCTQIVLLIIGSIEIILYCLFAKGIECDKLIKLYKINVNVVEIIFNSILCDKSRKLVILDAGEVLGEDRILPKTEISFSNEPHILFFVTPLH